MNGFFFVHQPLTVMLIAALVPLLALVHPVICQSTTAGGNIYEGDGPDFQPDSLTIGILALFCLFTLFFFVLTVWCFVALILARGHRSPYAFLFPALIFSVLGNADNIALEIILNMPSWYTFPTQLQPALEAIALFFTNWAILLLFLSLVALLWNRETALYAATEGKAGRRYHAFTAIYAILAVLLFALGTAAPAIYIDALRKYLIALNEVNFEFDENPSLDQYALENWFYQQSKVSNDVNYTFNTFVVLAGIVVVASTGLLWSAHRAAGIRDKLTDHMLFVVAPLYAFYNIVTFIFSIVFSNHGLPPNSSQTTIESATLAQNLLLLLFYFAVAFAILFLSINRKNWNAQGGTMHPIGNVATKQYWAQPYNSQPIGQPAYYYNGPQPQSYVPESQTALHSPAHV
ncbi:hypothetical protein PILCRDRAFT_830340 [Piloderma croceum F 1598]|uniref:Uncharacterized protein n=1 Tax=Piloderma croceum (strain F 1598) TaxID=765440 RepID=A0A0C3ETJ9_PILCF|nr:hypothetical protein PILCRDRAFT_830340 [Piloderma croceum F 1598]